MSDPPMVLKDIDGTLEGERMWNYLVSISFCARMRGQVEFEHFAGSEVIYPTFQNQVFKLVCPPNANAVRVATNTIVRIAIGENPDATGSLAVFMPEHTFEYFGCKPGDRVAVAYPPKYN
jgi:hypothetical protein